MNEQEFRDEAIRLMTEQTIYMKVMCKENDSSHKEIKRMIERSDERLIKISAALGIIIAALGIAGYVVG